MKTIDELLHRSVKICDDSKPITDVMPIPCPRNPFLPWKRITRYWCSENKNCHSFTSSQTDLLENTMSPEVMARNLKKLTVLLSRRHSCIVGFYNADLKHTGIVYYVGMWLVISRYGHENGIFVAKLEDVADHYGIPVFYRNDFEGLKNCYRMKDSFDLESVSRRLRRLQNPIVRACTKLLFLSSHYSGAPVKGTFD